MVSPAVNDPSGPGRRDRPLAEATSNLGRKAGKPRRKPGDDSDTPEGSVEMVIDRPAWPINQAGSSGQARLKVISKAAETQNQASRAFMAPRPNGPGLSILSSPDLDCELLLLIVFLLIGLLLLFAVQKNLGDIFQAVLKSEATTRPAKKRSNLDYRLENTVCWLVVTFTSSTLQMYSMTVQTLARANDPATLVAGTGLWLYSIASEYGAFPMVAVFKYLIILCHSLVTPVCIPPQCWICRRAPHRPSGYFLLCGFLLGMTILACTAACPWCIAGWLGIAFTGLKYKDVRGLLAASYTYQRRLISCWFCIYLLWGVVTWLCLCNSGWLWIIVAGLGHAFTKDFLSETLQCSGPVKLGGGHLPPVLWILIGALFCHSWCTMQPRKACEPPLPNVCSRPYRPWRSICLIVLILSGISGLIHLNSTYPVLARNPSLTIPMGDTRLKSASDMVCGTHWQQNNNELSLSPFEHTIWIGARVVREDSASLLLHPDSRHLLRLRGGMPQRSSSRTKRGGCKELSAESGMVDSAHTRFNESEPAGIGASLRCMEGNNGPGVMTVEAPGVSVDTSCMVESTGMTVPDAGNDRTNPRVGTSNNYSEVRKWNIRVDQNTRGNSEVTIRTSADSKINDSIERSQQADGSLMAIAGGGIKGVDEGSYSTISDVKTGNQEVNAIISVRDIPSASGDTSGGVGLHDTANSNAGDGCVGSLTAEFGTRRRKLRDTAYAWPTASISVSLNTAESGKQHGVTTRYLHDEVPVDIFEAERRLKQFDYSTRWGPTPSSSLTRSERLARGRRLLAPVPAGWEWVDDIIRRFPALGDLKATDQYKLPNRTTEPMPEQRKLPRTTRLLSESLVPLTRTEEKKARVRQSVSGMSTATLVSMPHDRNNRPLKVAQIGEDEAPKRHLFNHTLQNYGNTCFFNVALQAVASVAAFRAAIETAPLPPDHADSSYCLAFLKLFIPAIASPSLEPSKRLDITSVESEGRRMSIADWLEFVHRLTTKFDPRYALGAFADPGDLLNYFLSIVPAAGQMCTLELTWTTTFPCACQAESERKRRESEQEIMISVNSVAPLIHHVLAAFSPEVIADYGCDQCQAPATRQRLLTSPPRFLRVSIIAPRTFAAPPPDYRHGQLLEYDELDLSPVTQSGQAYYTLCAAIMYCKRHYWIYLHGRDPTLIDDDVSRPATPEDKARVAQYARILIYERAPLPPSCSLHSGRNESDAAMSVPTTSQEQQAGARVRRRSPPLPSSGARTGPKQRTLRDFFSAMTSQSNAYPSKPVAASQARAAEPARQKTPLTEGVEHLYSERGSSLLMTDNVTCPAPTLPACPAPPGRSASTGANQGGVTMIDMSRLIVLRPSVSGSAPWKPGTPDLYPLPKGFMIPGSSAWPCTLPLWKVRVEGLQPQQAMFQVADNLSPSAFYIAADDWTRKDGVQWGIGKRYGAFRSAAEFVTDFLEISRNRCFYEIIRQDRPCKAYLDLEADAGAMTEQEGQAMCDAVIREWKGRISSRWPSIVKQCAQCLGYMILKGSRLTDDGLKISYHVIFPWLVFPCNTTMLRDVVGSMSEMPQFQYTTTKGDQKPFIDSAVYTRNRQFRLLLCNKLSDRSRTALLLSSPPTIAMFVRSCITHIEGAVGLVPQDPIPRTVAAKSSAKKQHRSGAEPSLAPPTFNPLCSFLLQLLHRQGQPNGALTLVSASKGDIKFRWQVPSNTLRPCLTAQIWRPSQAGHKSNGAWVLVDNYGGVYLTCLHPQCLQRGYCNKRLLGYAPLSLLNLHEGADNETQCSARTYSATPHPTPHGGVASSLEQTTRRTASRVSVSVDLPILTSTSSEPSQHHDDGELQAGMSCSTFSECPRGQQHRKRSREQSLSQVAAENQHGEHEPFQAWSVETGQWGGRVMEAPATVNPTSRASPEPGASLAMTLLDWVASSEASPFTVHPPDSLISSIHAELLQDNVHHAREHAQARVDDPCTAQPAVRSDAKVPAGVEHGWSVGPTQAWLQAPIATRTSVGHDLLSQATSSIWTGATEHLACPFRVDTWSSPFTVGYLNVGRRHLVGSLQEVVDLVLKYRLDILFLGDLVTSRNHIGRLKKLLESGLHDEWFVTTNVSDRPGRPVGIGAIVHCSLASHMSDCVLQCPYTQGSDTEMRNWMEAVDGRIQRIKITRPGSPLTWQFVGVYQHVAKSSNRAARAHVRDTLRCMVNTAKQENCRMVILGDFNAAPPGGRWGYSKGSSAVKEDCAMTDWVQAANLTEVLPRGKPTPTWKPSEGPQKAALDRVLVTHDDLASLELSVRWHCPLLVFDHALLTLQIQHTLIGTGYAGACRPEREVSARSRCRVNLRSWRGRVSEWSHLVQAGLKEMSTEHQEHPPDPFESLKRGELLADSVARALAPKHVWKPGDTRRAFGFAGNRLLFRELNLLRKARSIVFEVFAGNTTLLHCPHRFVRWTLATRDLHLRVRRSGHAVPQPLDRQAHAYFRPAARERLRVWLETTKEAIASRQAAVRESYDKAKYHNLQNLRKKQKEANGVLDKRTIQVALGKCQPRQRMWGVSGPVVLGAKIEVPVAQQLTVLDFLKGMHEADTIVHLSGDEQGVSIWFSGPRQAGDFVLRWNSTADPVTSAPIRPLKPPGQYVAIRPDDMLSVQEWHMVSEGMDTYSVCPTCQAKGLHVISTTATHQRFGNPTRAVRFFCEQCQSVCDEPALSPMPPCPIPEQVLAEMRRIPAGTPPLLNRPVGFETLERCRRKQPNGRAPGEDGIPREFCKYGPLALLELYWKAINAFLKGDAPSVCPSEWTGAVAGQIPKALSALLMTELRPIACICTKSSLFLKILDDRLGRATEDYQLNDDTQEGFRRNRSTQRQLGKLHSILAEQRRRKVGLSVLLYLDIKNAFNAVNHRAIFHIFEAKGFPEADIALLRRMYTGSFLVMASSFGVSAACVLSRGVAQGAQPSPRVFNLAFDPVHAVVRDCRRGCTLQGSIDPTGSSGFADDSPLHTDGPDAIPAMAVLVKVATDYIEWAGMEVHLKKCGITAMDMKTGQSVATDSITLHGAPFPVIPPDQPHKHLGVRMALNGDFSAEKEHVCREMQKRLTALAEDRVLSRKEKEVVIRTAVCSVFCYSAGHVNWTRTELDSISRMWTRAYKQAWSLPGCMDSSPIIVDQSVGGRGCPLAVDLWTRAVLEVLEQCVSLPGEISQIVTHHLKQQCIAHGCYTLNQLQLLLRVTSKAKSVLELFLSRLDEQGLEISSPWMAPEAQSITEILWPRIHKAWLDKERWTGCREVIDDVQREWDQALVCLRACAKLGRTEPAILSILQLSGCQAQWMHIDELRKRQCCITSSEYATLTSWLPATNAVTSAPEGEVVPLGERSEAEDRGCDSQLSTRCLSLVAKVTSGNTSTRYPPCIRGQIASAWQNDQLVLRSFLPDRVSEMDISRISDSLLADYLCQGRAIFPYSCSEDDTFLVECLAPLRKLVTPYPLSLDYIVARQVERDDAPLTVMHMSLVRDCLLGIGRESLEEACSRPCWTVTKDEFYGNHCLTSSARRSVAPTWKLRSDSTAGQMRFAGAVHCIMQRRHQGLPRPVVIAHPWQADPPLPSRITIDVVHHHPKGLPAPDNWEIIQRNGRVWISDQNNRIVRMDAAQYGLLLTTCYDQDIQRAPLVKFLEQICASCRAQQDADQDYCVPWSRHFLANIRWITGSELLVGASAVTYNPHFLHFSSPYLADIHLGAVDEWPQVPALLVLDSFAPQLRCQMLERAVTHSPGVWVLRQQKGNPDEPGLAMLWRAAHLYAELPKRSMVMHREGCWETAAWDVEPSSFVTQLWKLNTHPEVRQQAYVLRPGAMQQQLERGGHHQYAFHWNETPVPPQARLSIHRRHQQDALRHGWSGLVAGTDGSVDVRAERMGAGYVVGVDPVPDMVFSARVGGPLSTARAEAASLLQLLLDVKQQHGHQTHLLVFVDCLVVLDILQRWGRSDFHPGPKEIVHFAVIRPLLYELRQWSGTVTLVKIKSHTGCLLNERADEQAGLGRIAEGPEICPGPQKYGSFWLRVRPDTREFTEKCGMPLPRDSAPNRSLLTKVAASNILRAVKKRSTLFVTGLFHHKVGAAVSKTIRRCTPAVYRIWLKCMTGIYPVQTYLKRIGVAKSPTCPHCNEEVPESLAHFACVCPKFREARTSAHNQVRDVVTSFFNSALGSKWTVFEETRMSKTGLVLQPTSLATVSELGRRQPDWVLASTVHKRIAIVDLCRPSDTSPAQLLAAAMRKQNAYCPLVEALRYYVDQGWAVHVFPLVVGICGMIDPSHVESLLKFLHIQRKLWQGAIERTVLASVHAFHFLHKVRFGGHLDSGRLGLNPECAGGTDDDDAAFDGRRPRKSRRTDNTLVCTDSDSEATDNPGVAQPPSKTRRTLSVQPQVPEATEVGSTALSAYAVAARQTPPLLRSASATARGRIQKKLGRKRARKENTTRARTTTTVMSRARPNACSECNQTRSRQQPKRKRSECTSTTQIFDTNDPDHRQIMQHQSTSGGEHVDLWNRWRRLEPRKRRRT